MPPRPSSPRIWKPEIVGARPGAATESVDGVTVGGSTSAVSGGTVLSLWSASRYDSVVTLSAATVFSQYGQTLLFLGPSIARWQFGQTRCTAGLPKRCSDCHCGAAMAWGQWAGITHGTDQHPAGVNGGEAASLA